MTLNEIIEQVRKESALVRSGTCPQCGGKMSLKKDQRQAGPSRVVGEWHNAKCLNCDYFCDVVIPQNN